MVIITKDSGHIVIKLLFIIYILHKNTKNCNCYFKNYRIKFKIFQKNHLKCTFIVILFTIFSLIVNIYNKNSPVFCIINTIFFTGEFKSTNKIYLLKLAVTKIFHNKHKNFEHIQNLLTDNITGFIIH